ncbi:MerR family transcriptional regulator [Sphaerisporangium sp. NPDC005288]|uniref:helix-turn-helix domain-containing protein n=1 Tax=Sphaerisporangium sp. NPDC005288 TaxID=3155114 RepID=UPI0033BA7F53
MELIPIGEAARRLGVSTSALRYYDERGLVPPAERSHGHRRYGPDELRRLAFIQIMQRLGLNLDTAAAVLDEPGEQWRQTVREQIEKLEELIRRAQDAQLFLQHALMCPTEHPTRECTYMTEALDRMVGGTSFEQLIAEHAEHLSAP